MCGFAGIIDPFQTRDGAALLRIAKNMGVMIAHRGPDDCDNWSDQQAGIAMMFFRLAIVDLSPAGRQPMVSRSGRYAVMFNGEIYNAPNLRTELLACGAQFRGHSDTEVLVELIDQRGI